MFDDELVIESPGGFPPLVTPDNILTLDDLRNPAELFENPNEAQELRLVLFGQ